MPDFLRGSFAPNPAPVRNWDGWYVGGQVGYSAGAVDFSQSVTGLTNYIFRDTVLQQPTGQLSLLNKTNMQGTGFGGFVGRNYQWDDIVLGVEANYNYLDSLATSTKGSLSLDIVNPPGTNAATGQYYHYLTTLSGEAAAQVKDMITFRGRMGWATGDFLPYVFGGLAVGRMDVSRGVTSDVDLRIDTTVTVNGNSVIVPGTTNAVPSLSQSQIQERSNNFVAGWTGGLGLEYRLWNGVFMRGEWEYIKFISVENTNVTMNSVRAGLGYKF
jgi:opacity protein-like surface antigen